MSDLNTQIEIVMRQTNYSEDVAREKLAEHNNDTMATIRSYLGVPEKKAVTAKSTNQEVYRQIRHKLDAGVREYNIRKEASESEAASESKSASKTT